MDLLEATRFSLSCEGGKANTMCRAPGSDSGALHVEEFFDKLGWWKEIVEDLE
jgi:hypothetical protein